MIDCIQENSDISKIILYNGIQKNNLEESMETNRSRVEENGTVRESTRYMIISDGKMSAQTFGDSRRGHWGIENQLALVS